MSRHSSDKNCHLFHSCGHSSVLQSRAGQPLHVFTPQTSIIQAQSMNDVCLMDVGEDVDHLQIIVMCHMFMCMAMSS